MVASLSLNFSTKELIKIRQNPASGFYIVLKVPVERFSINGILFLILLSAGSALCCSQILGL